MVIITKEEWIKEDEEWKVTFEQGEHQWVFYVRDLIEAKDVIENMKQMQNILNK